MNKRFLVLAVLLLVAGIAVAVYTIGPRESLAPTDTRTFATLEDLIVVDAPAIDAHITSPYTISGKARGPWYFEASAPFELKDSAGTVIGHGYVTAQGEWMTEGYVPFTAVVTFTKPATPTGTLILRNDNPSGDPERQKTLEIPVKFQ